MTATSAQIALTRRCVARMLRAGVPVRWCDGWDTRGRPYPYAPVGVLQHHDASPTSTGDAGYLRGIIDGRPDVPGPLAQWQVGRDGTWWVVAAGRANHAGEGGPWRTVPADSGNRYLVGVEVANDGRGEPYSPQLRDRLTLGLACLLLELDRDATWLTFHRIWTPRKTDPTLNYTTWADAVDGDRLALTTGDWLTMATEEQLRTLLRQELWGREIVSGAGGNKMTAGQALDYIYDRTAVLYRDTPDQLAAVHDVLTAMAALLKELPDAVVAALPAPQAGGLTVDQVVAAVKTATRELDVLRATDRQQG